LETKLIRTEKAKIGMVAAGDVYLDDSQMILSKDTVLTEKTLERLAHYCVEKIPVYVEESEAELSYQEKIRKTPEFKEFNKSYDSMVDSLEVSMQGIVYEEAGIKQEELLAGVDEILEKSRNGLHTLEMMQCMREYDDLTYAHCVSVSLLCNTIGSWMGYKGVELREVTLGGLLHDIGKLCIPPELIKKPGKLTDEEYKIVKNHPVLGYEILRRANIDPQISMPALCHHERCDGSGYPFGVSLRRLNEYSRITAIADVYDAMTADRVYRKGLCPFEVIAMFEREGFEKYDTSVILPFLSRLSESYIGSTVLLSDDRRGEIIMINPQKLSKPVVRVGDDFIDLSKKEDLRVKEIVR
jgi:putative nucleotidyltransferase with HDIG domain